MKSRWRAAVFGLVAVAAALTGVVLHFQAHSGGVEPAPGDPLQIGVYLADPTVPIAIRVELRRDEKLRRKATIFVNAPLHTRMIITSSLPTTDGARSNFRALPKNQGGEGQFSYFSGNDNSLALPSVDPRGFALGEFELPDDTFVQDGDSVAVRMPTVATAEDGTQYLPGLGSVDDFLSFPTSLYTQLEPGSGYQLGDRSPGHYMSRLKPDMKFTELFWEPENLTTTETAEGVGELPNSRYEVVSPSNGTAAADRFTWTGSYGLAGVLVATDRSLQDKLANYEFLSGVALATAAAALVALVQEGSDRLLWFRRRRRGPAVTGGPLANAATTSRVLRAFNQRRGRS